MWFLPSYVYLFDSLVNLVRSKWLGTQKKVKVNCSGTEVASGLVSHCGDLSSRREFFFFSLPDISLANTRYLTWLGVCMYQPSQQSSNHVKVHTPRRCQIIIAPYFFWWLLTCTSCSRGYLFCLVFFLDSHHPVLASCDISGTIQWKVLTFDLVDLDSRKIFRPL